ncbi:MULTISPECIES: DUF4294 domain-containing protein [Muribaculaceae]|nr:MULTISPECIES: DUF4294 domain-containing protein [Muribaculaceae]GFI67868.1 hypothetical protein IMSAG192_01403 [Muribaculaceae bacterium]
MKNIFCAIIMILSCVVSVSAQDDTSDGVVGILDEPTLKDARIPLVRGRYHFVSEEGDTAIMVVLNNITYFPPLKFKNKKQEQFYWRTVRDVKRTLPYAKMIAETILETYEYMETLPSQEERQRHLQQMEKEVFNQYKPQLKKFTKSQGKMLVKLITRETNQSSYSILKAFLGTFRAGFWQTFGRFFGVNLKSDFRPDKNEEDAIIERVCVLVEQGML